MSTQTPSAYLLPNNGWDERIHAFQFSTLVTCHAVVSERYVVLIDTMISPATAQVMLDHVAPFLTAGRQLLVINTHFDWDHSWGNQLFSGPAAVHPAPVIATEACAAELRAQNMADYLAEKQAQSPVTLGDVVLAFPTITFRDSLGLDGGDLSFELFATPGHTHDQIAIYIPEIKTLFAADAAEDPYPEPRKGEDMGQMRDTLASLAKIDAECVLYCHSTDVTARTIHENIAYFDAIETACRAAMANGVPLPDELSADLGTLIGCTFEDAMPNRDYTDLRDYYKTTGHYGNIRNIWAQLKRAA